MRKLIGGLLIVACLLPIPAKAADAVEPASCAVISVRDEDEAYINAVKYPVGSTLWLTNCIAYNATTTNGAVQGLDTVTIDVDVGRVSTNINYSGTVVSAVAGTWWSAILVPTDVVANEFSIQIKLTDENTNIYIYPLKKLHTRDAL